MPRQVVLLSHGFQSEYEIGFANGLARAGIAVNLVGSDNTLISRRAPGVSVINLRGSQRSDRKRLEKALNLMRYVVSYLHFVWRNRRLPVHVSGLFSTRSTLISVVEAFLTRMIAGSFVLTVHNLLPHDRHTTFNHCAYWLMYRLPHRLMVHTERMARELHERFAVPREKIVVVEHGFDRLMEDDPQLRKLWRSRHGIPQDAGVILMFGVVARYKGPDLLLQAFEAMNSQDQAHVVIAGHCRDEQLRQDLLRLIAAHRHQDRIHWLDGYVPSDEIQPLFSAADCVVLPYRHIDQSGVLLMALSSGLPIVATNVGSFADYLKAGLGQVVPPNDTEALAEALSAVLRERAAASRSERIDAVRSLDWQRTVLPLLPVYDSLCKP